jgi:hypothetical protein
MGDIRGPAGEIGQARVATTVLAMEAVGAVMPLQIATLVRLPGRIHKTCHALANFPPLRLTIDLIIQSLRTEPIVIGNYRHVRQPRLHALRRCHRASGGGL